ncbi:MAG: acetyl-CoA C-acetyltransferase [Acholeplasmatales bacterium]|jgi:acetyl-CoA C-acetyltransferase|nr:acetyl-CoA C-acetyltransferase [Acholeplasmatales bacterium]
MKKKVYIVAAKRTATGSFLGGLANLSPSEFGSAVVKELLISAHVNPQNIDTLICGNILSAGLGQGIARQIAIKAGIPQEVTAYSLNMLCGSGLKAVMNAYQEIISGYANLIVAGGSESMSGAPFLVSSANRSGSKMGEQKLVDHLIYDALTDAFNGYHMGITAENIAEKYHISRLEQDEFAYNSQLKARRANDAGLFKDEIVPIVQNTRKGEVIFDKDEYINYQTDLTKLSALRPAFKKDGTVTAGNASGINDAASFVLVASEEAVKKYNLTPLVEIVGLGQGGVDPAFMGLGPVPAVKAALKDAKLKLEDIDVLELNEAFAAQSLGVVKLLAKANNIPEEDLKAKINPLGGAIALGHPVGASGNRILVTLIHNLLKSDVNTYGLASLCIGGGMGACLIVKKI